MVEGPAAGNMSGVTTCREERPFYSAGVIWLHGWGGAVAGNGVANDTESVLGKVTIGLMGKGAVMSSHGRKTPLSL